MTQRAGDAIVRSLETHDIRRLYCVPGESYLTLLDALFDAQQIETIICRHESGAGFMALAEAKITGTPGVFAVSRGPGATNGAIALHVAEQDATPLICLIGQVSRREKGRGAFQEMDYHKFFGSVCKAVFEPDQADQVPEVFAQAFVIAQTGTPGPVVISLPEDMLGDVCNADIDPPMTLPKTDLPQKQQAELLKLLAVSQRPLIIAGNQMRPGRAKRALAEFAEHHQIPVACGWKAQDVFDNTHALYAGHIGFAAPPAQREILGKADLVIAMGTRLGDITSMNYTLLEAPNPKQPLVHVYNDTGPIDKVFKANLGIVCDPADLLESLNKDDVDAAVTPERAQWRAEIKTFVDGFMAFNSGVPEDGVDFGSVVTCLAGLTPPDTVVVTDSGNFSSWVHRYWRLGAQNTMLGAIGGAMGFGVPGAVAVSLAAPERCVVCVVGDGGMLMTGQELATAVRYGARPKIILSDNGIYGTIRTHQEKRFPNRVSGTDLTNPDFSQWAASFGVQVFTIELGDDVETKLQSALDHDGASFIHVKSSKEAISAFTTLSALRGR